MPDTRIAMFIDGGYLDKLLQLQFNRARIDYEALSQWMARGNDILRTYYYNCLPYKGHTPTPEQERQYSNAQSFHAKLNMLPHYEVREGVLEFRGIDRDTGRPIYQQKRVDIKLGVDMVRLASKGRISHAAILTGDSDFLPAVEAVQTEGVILWLYHSTYFDLTRNIDCRPHGDLVAKADNRTTITQAVIDSILRH
ncbi:MAG: NYN domain-containing protein [Thermacetogeniaceae bacterium]